MADNIQIDVSTTLENVNVEVAELPQPSISIDYSYPQGPQGIQGPPGVNTWGSLSGTLSAQTDLWYYLSAVSTSNFDIATLNNYLSTTPVLLSSLNVNGTILSAGVNLFDIFLTSETDSQTLTYIPSSYLLSISNGNTVNLSSINSLFGSVSGKYEEAYTNLITNSAAYLSSVDLSFLSVSGNWNTAYNIATAYQSVSSSFATNTTVNNVSSLLTPLTLTNTLTSQLLPTSIYQNVSGNWQSTYTTVTNNSGSWISLATVTNYLSTNNVRLSGATVTGNVTVTGTVSSANTITGYNLATQNQVQYLSSGVVKVYQYYNTTTNSLDTVFN